MEEDIDNNVAVLAMLENQCMCDLLNEYKNIIKNDVLKLIYLKFIYVIFIFMWYKASSPYKQNMTLSDYNHSQVLNSEETESNDITKQSV